LQLGPAPIPDGNSSTSLCAKSSTCASSRGERALQASRPTRVACSTAGGLAGSRYFGPAPIGVGIGAAVTAMAITSDKLELFPVIAGGTVATGEPYEVRSPYDSSPVAVVHRAGPAE